MKKLNLEYSKNGFKQSSICYLWLILIILFCQFLNCKEDCRVGINIKYKKDTDSTYYALRDSLTIYENIERSTYLETPALNNWDDIVRLRGSSGWGTFDYICSIYNDNNKRIQLIRQNRHPRDDVNYTYRERILTNEEYDNIMELIERNEVYEMPFDLEPNQEIIDGSNYTIAIKKKDFTKVVFWQDYRNIDTKEKEKAIRIFREILRQANYPLPKGFISKLSETQDSIIYEIGLDDYELLMDFDAKFQGKKIIKGWNSPSLKIAKKDTSLLKKEVSIEVVLSNNEIVEIENIKIEN